MLISHAGGALQVHGLARNPESVTRSAVLTATLVEQGGRLVGIAVGTVLDVPPNDTKPFTLVSSDPVLDAVDARVVLAAWLPATQPTAPPPLRLTPGAVRARGNGFVMEARVTNEDRQPHRFTLVGSLLDAGGNLVGVARSAPLTLAPGESTSATLTSPDPLPSFVTARVQVDVLEE